MPTLSAFDYAILRVVPRVEREEFINAGVILYCLTRDFLKARVELDAERLKAFAPASDLPLIEAHLQAMVRICEGGKEAGPIGQLSQKERWHWLVAPKSTVIQTGPVHAGLCENPALALDKLLDAVVRLPRAG